jgi:hypothetical protein
MQFQRSLSSPVHATLRHVLLIAGLALAITAGCGGTTKCASGDCSSGGTGGGSSSGHPLTISTDLPDAVSPPGAAQRQTSIREIWNTIFLARMT